MSWDWIRKENDFNFELAENRRIVDFELPSFADIRLSYERSSVIKKECVHTEMNALLFTPPSENNQTAIEKNEAE